MSQKFTVFSHGATIHLFEKSVIEFNTFVRNVPFLYPLKTSEKPCGASGTNRLKVHSVVSLIRNLLEISFEQIGVNFL